MIALFAARVRTGRILVNAPTAVGALGGVYNSLTPTFSLGCGTWGGSMTTDNVNYRNLLNVKTVSRRQAPPQWFRVPTDTYFNAGAIENLRELKAEQVLLVTDRDVETRGVAEEVRPYLEGHGPRLLRDQPEPTEAADPRRRRGPGGIRADCIVAVGGGSVLDAAKSMRLFHESPELVEGAVAALPRRAQAGRPVPRGRSHGAAGRGPDHHRHRLGGFAARPSSARPSER